MELKRLTHLFVTIFLYNYATLIVVPSLIDVTMAALCPGKDECSLAIYLSGFQQAITGLGSLVMMPIVGNLSDSYGRKALLSLPMTLTVIPLVILAYKRTTYYYYAFYVIKIMTSMFCEGTVHCVALAYVADNVPEAKRASAFGLLSGIGSSAFVCGTLTARFLSTSSSFQVSAFLVVLATFYMRIFLPDSNCQIDASSPLLSKSKNSQVNPSIGESSCRKLQIGKSIPSLHDMILLLTSSRTFTLAAIVAFFSSLADGGVHSSMLYYLKAQFHFNKDQFADLMLIGGISGATSQLVVMPMLAPYLREEILLRIGLLAGCATSLIFSMAWSSWVPYVTSVVSVVSVFAQPCLRSIASKQVGSEEQGKAQGCISSICSFANIISPLAFSPLTALFLSEKAPFHFPGFSILCIGFLMMIAFILSFMIRVAPPISSDKISSSSHAEA